MRVAAAGLVLLACTSLGAQADRFEVVSVKPNTTGEQRTRGLEMLPGGVVRGTSVPLWLVIQSAYDLRLKQLEYDSPLLTERFDINAKADNAALEAASPDVRRQRISAMLRTLLAERFKLAVRRETRTLPVYALVVKAVIG